MFILQLQMHITTHTMTFYGWKVRSDYFWSSVEFFVLIWSMRRQVTAFYLPQAGCIAAIAADVGYGLRRSVASVCLLVCALKGKRLELSTPNLVHIYSIVVAGHALTQRSKGQGHTVTKTVTVASFAFCHVTNKRIWWWWWRWLLVTRAATAVCCCCRRGSACRYNCPFSSCFCIY